jgi:hypothetical protein
VPKSPRAQDWEDTHPDEAALLKRCWDRDPKYLKNAPARDSEDLKALAEWVTRTVMTAPILIQADWWPPRFRHEAPDHTSELFRE